MEERAKILLVDDTPENIHTLGALLEKYKRQVALCGEKAIQLAREKPQPDLILLDIMMPDMDGYEVCQRLRDDELTQNIPIIFITSKTERDDVLKGFQIGAQDYITKPFDSHELMARVKTQLEIVANRKKLEELNTNLEGLVDQRTQELQTTNKELEEAKKELESFDSSKSEFLQIISHEIRTPLNGIIGGLNVLKELEISEDTLEFIDLLDESVNRLEKFSYSALNISELKTKGSSVLKKTYINIADIFTNIETITSKRLSEKSLILSVTYTGEIDAVEADIQYIQKAFLNLADNAIKFSPSGGSILIQVHFESEKVSVSVKDEGNGFNEKMLKGLTFLSNSEHVDQNPGLGLYLTHLIIQSHGGKLEYGNNSDGGATVKVQLPLNS